MAIIDQIQRDSKDEHKVKVKDNDLNNIALLAEKQTFLEEKIKAKEKQMVKMYFKVEEKFIITSYQT